MSIQRQIGVTALVGAGAFALTGCAGLLTPFINNPYAGDYNGTFTTSDGKAGPASVQLTKLGNVFGTLTDTKSNTSGNLTGSVKSSLTFNGTLGFPGSKTESLSGTFTSDNGVISGTVNGADGYTLTLMVNTGVTTGGAEIVPKPVDH